VSGVFDGWDEAKTIMLLIDFLLIEQVPMIIYCNEIPKPTSKASSLRPNFLIFGGFTK